MKLYEFGPTRSTRVRWTLQELGVPAGEDKLLGDLPNMSAYMQRMYARPKAALRIAEAFARVNA